MARLQRKSSGRAASKGFPNPIDVHVGARIRLRRTLLGISQTTLADAMGLTFQQVQKYESGANRVSSSRLYDAARILDVPLPYFFDEMAAGVSAPDSLRAYEDEATAQDGSGEGSARQARDDGVGASLLQDRRSGGAEAGF